MTAPFKSTIGVLLSAGAILTATLHLAGTELPSGWSLALTSGDEGFAEILQNIILFIPLGLALALRRGPAPAWRLAAAGAGLSFAVEFAQQWIPGRDPSLGDLVFNTLGTALGVLLVRTAPRWLALPRSHAAWLSLGAALAAATVWLATGWLLRPILPRSGADASEIRTPNPGRHMDLYSGRVLSVTGRLRVAEPLTIAAVAGTPSGRLAPLLLVENNEGPGRTLVAVDRDDLVLRNRSRSMLLTLDRPDLRARGALAGVAPGDTFTVTAWTDGKGPGFCLARDAERWCGLAYTMGDGWRLIFYPEHFPPSALRLLNALWVAGWCLGAGWWARRHPATGAGLAVVAAALLAGPGLVGLLRTPMWDLAGAAGGVVGGWLTRRLASPPDGRHVSPTSEAGSLH